MKGIHGYSIEELEKFISSVLKVEQEITIDTSILDGWSSINLLCYISGKPRYVIKLPKYREKSNFTHLYRLHEDLSRHGICSRPVYQGNLTNDVSILILEYIEGKIYNSPFDISSDHMSMLRDVLDKLSTTNPRGIPIYCTTRDHLESIITPMKKNLDQHDRTSTNRLTHLFEEYIQLMSEVGSAFWDVELNAVTIHGDLYERNIVFQRNKALLLDLEECCKADPYYDIVYLYVQSYSGTSDSKAYWNPDVCTLEHWITLEKIALCSVITWSIQRLLDQKMGLISKVLSGMVPDDLILDYVEKKMEALHSILDV